MLLVGPNMAQLASFAGALERAGISTRHSDDIAQAAAMGVEAQSTVIVVVTDLKLPQAHETLAALATLPSTQELPALVLSRESPLAQEVAALTAGAIDIVQLPTELPVFVDRIHALLSAKSDVARVRAAKDMRGPALLKRVGNHIRLRKGTATLDVIGPTDGGMIAFREGRIEKARFGPHQGSAAIERLLTTPTHQRWAIRLRQGEVHTQPMPAAPATETPEPTFTIDIEIEAPDSDAPSTAARASSVDLDIVVEEPPASAAPPAPATSRAQSEDLDIVVDTGATDPTDTSVGEEEIFLDDDDDIELFEVSPESGPPSIESLDGSTNTLPPPNILVVDDDEALLNIYSKFLARDGAQVTTACDGQAGYDAALKVRPDAIVSDIMMPNVDGWGFLTSVRHDMRIRDTKFLLLSCHGEYLSQLKSLDAGADAYLEKGLRGDEVAKHVDRALKERRHLLASLKPGVAFSGQLSTYGVRPLLRAVANAGLSGVLTIEDRFGRYILQFEMGRLVAALAAVGSTERKSDQALAVVLNLDDGTFEFESDVLMLVDEEPRSVDAVIEAIGATLNARRKAAEERMFASDARLLAEPELAKFYALVCPEAARPVAEALCSGTAPKALMVQSEASPLLIESVVRDLLRKGVARFAPAPS